MYKLFSALMIHRIPSEEELAASEGRAQRSGCMVRLPVKKPIPAMMMVVKWYHCVLALSSAPSTSNAPLVPIAMSLSLNVPSLWNHTKSALSRILLHLENPHSQTPKLPSSQQKCKGLFVSSNQNSCKLSVPAHDDALAVRTFSSYVTA